MRRVRQVDKMACTTGCVLTQADLSDTPKGTSAADLLEWIANSRRIVNNYLDGLKRLP